MELLAHFILVPSKVALQKPLYKGSVNGTRANGVGADALVRKVDCDGARHADDGPFARAIRETPVDSDHARH